MTRRSVSRHCCAASRSTGRRGHDNFLPPVLTTAADQTSVSGEGRERRSVIPPSKQGQSHMRTISLTTHTAAGVYCGFKYCVCTGGYSPHIYWDHLNEMEGSGTDVVLVFVHVVCLYIFTQDWYLCPFVPFLCSCAALVCFS